MRLNRRAFAGGVSSAIALTLATKGDLLTQATPQASPVARITHEIVHPQGTTHVPIDPQRIVNLGDEWLLADLLELGVVPIASSATYAAAIPVIGVNTFDATPPDTISRFEALAGALGVDLAGDEQVAARQAHTDAEAAFVAAVDAKPGLTVLGVTGDPTRNAFVLNPVLLGDLKYFNSLGLEFVVPENPDPAQLNLFETLAWEELGRYPADVVIYDSRMDPPTGDPIWDSLPAVQAGQVGTWYASLGYSWPELTRYLQTLTTTVDTSEVLN